MKALILAGGYGTRLLPLTLRTPKCMLPIAGRPNIIHLIGLLREAGILDIWVSMNTNQFKVKEFLGDGSAFGVKINYIFEETKDDCDKLGAIGALQYVAKEVGSDDYLILGADNFFFGLHINNLISYHAEKNALITLALYSLFDKSKVEHYGVAVLDDSGRVRMFQEKPKVEEAKSKLASTLIYRIDRSFFDKYLGGYVDLKLGRGEKPDNLGELWQFYVEELDIYGFTFEGFWGDVGKPHTYIEINKKAMNLMKGRSIAAGARVSPGAELVGDGIIIEEGAVIGKGAKIIGPAIIGRGCVIKKGAVVGLCTSLLRDCEIGEGCRLSGSVFFDNISVGSGSRVENSVVDGNVKIGENCRVENYSLLGFGCTISCGSKLFSRSRVWPSVCIDGESIVSGDVKVPDGVFGSLRSSCFWK